MACELKMDVREKLVELLNGIIDGGFKWNSYNYESGEQLNNNEIASHLISNGVTVQEWISVKDKLPENDGQYLIFTTQYFTPDHIDEIDRKDGIEISGYCKRYGFLSKNGIHAKYWQPMPQPPKGETNNA